MATLRESTSTLSWPGSSRPSRLGRHHLAAGTHGLASLSGITDSPLRGGPVMTRGKAIAWNGPVSAAQHHSALKTRVNALVAPRCARETCLVRRRRRHRGVGLVAALEGVGHGGGGLHFLDESG